jgi:hypothetical protein
MGNAIKFSMEFACEVCGDTELSSARAKEQDRDVEAAKEQRRQGETG